MPCFLARAPVILLELLCEIFLLLLPLRCISPILQVLKGPVVFAIRVVLSYSVLPVFPRITGNRGHCDHVFIIPLPLALLLEKPQSCTVITHRLCCLWIRRCPKADSVPQGTFVGFQESLPSGTFLCISRQAHTL